MLRKTETPAPALAKRAVEHRQLPPAVGFGSLYERRVELQEPAQAVCLNKADDGLVIRRRGRVEAVGPVRVVGMPVVGAGDQGDPLARFCGRACERPACADVLVERAITRRADDHHRYLRFRATTHDP